MNAKLQIARRDKKALLSDQCKEIEENNRMGKTRDLFKKIRDTEGTFHANMGSLKDRNGMDLTEAEDIKKRWQEYWSGLSFPEEGFLISSCNSLELCIQMGIAFLFSFVFAALCFTAIFKAFPDSHFAFLHSFFSGMVLITVSCTMS